MAPFNPNSAQAQVRGLGMIAGDIGHVGSGQLGGYAGPSVEQMEAQAAQARRYERMEVLRLAAGCSQDATKVVATAEAYLAFLKGG